MTKPATDEDLERIRRKLDRIPMPVRLELEYDVAALLTRIHKEQEDRKTVEAAELNALDLLKAAMIDYDNEKMTRIGAEDRIKTMRVQTILQCADLCRSWMASSFGDEEFAAKSLADSMLLLLEPKP